MATYTTNLNLKKPAGGEEASILDINANMDNIDSAFAAENIYITMSGISALPHTYSDARITANHMVSEMILSNTSAQPSDWGYTTANGSITLTGTISGTTNVTLHLVKTY